MPVSLVKSAFSDFKCAMNRGTESDLVKTLASFRPNSVSW